MDYTWDGIKGGGTSPYEKGKYMPILRNHRYIFTIKEVKGPGFATLNEAVTSPDNFTNHNIVVVPIVIDAFTDITFNESGHFLAVTRTAMTLQGKHDATSTQNKFSVRTNYCWILLLMERRSVCGTRTIGVLTRKGEMKYAAHYSP